MFTRAHLDALVGVLLTGSLMVPAGAATGSPAAGDDPPFVSTVLADGPASTEAGCDPGSLPCVDEVVAEMQRRLDALGCDHDAPFALVYLRTTQEYRRAVEDPAFFADNAYVNHEDALFADLYFRAVDAHRAGALADVPPAWRVALAASAAGEVTALGDVLLGMNAHIRRDLPFVLNAIGLVDPAGGSRKADHDRVNVILDRVDRYVLGEVAARYDPTVLDGRTPASVMDVNAYKDLVGRWREQAWKDAERLAQAGTDAQRRTVAAGIDGQAGAMAHALASQNRDGPRAAGAGRDAYCAAHAGAG